MKRLSHLSDLHFGATDARVVAALERELAEFSPHLLIVTGDVTQRAKRAQFEHARAFLDGLPYPRLVVPGNHDIPPFWRPLPRLLDPFARFRRYFPRGLDELYADDSLLVLGLNTVDPWRWKEGKVSRAQIRWIEGAVDRHPDHFRVLAAHHPLLHLEGKPLRHRVEQSELLLSALGRAGIDLVLTGHLHESFSGPAAGGLAAGRDVLLAQASTATSTRLRGHENAYNRITVEGRRVKVELCAFRGGRFEGDLSTTWEARAGR